MNKSVETLVPDIYGLIQKVIDGETVEVSEEAFNALSEDLRFALKRFFKGDKKVRPEKTLYASEIGKPCRRQLWYGVHGYEGEPLLPHTKIKFLYGDILEALLLFLSEQAGHEVKDRQKEIEIPLPNGWRVRGRIDANIDGAPVDAKTASSYAFKKFQEGSLAEDDAFGYIPQLALYNEAQGHKGTTAFLAIDKQNGTLALDQYHASPAWFEKAIPDRGGLVKAMESEVPPKRGFEPEPEGKSGNLKLGINCSYCSFKNECWKDANGGEGVRGFAYSRGPVWLVKIAKTPDVPELRKGDEQ